jgi:hypothetical protein
MSHDQFYQTFQLGEQWQAEQEAREIEQANRLAAEAAARDKEFREQLEEQFPILKGWK